MSNLNFSDYTLFNHQKQAIDGCCSSPHRLIYRLPGTGKTLIGAEIVKAELSQDNKAFILWIGPANLLPQYKKFFGSFGLPSVIFDSKQKNIEPNSCIFTSYEMFRMYVKTFLSHSWNCVITDEFHKVKNTETLTNDAIWKLRKKVEKFYALTGTPFQNSPYEFFELINIVSGKNLSYACEETLQYRSPKTSIFRKFFGGMLGLRVKRLNQGPIIGVKDPKKLHSIISQYVDYIPPDVYLKECQLPTINETITYVQLSDEEIASYNRIFSTYRKKKDKLFLSDDLDDENIEACFNNLIRLRQNLLDNESKRSAKIIKCVEDIRDTMGNKSNKTLVFCNFIEFGLNQLANALDSLGIKYHLYDGGTTKSDRQRMLSSYMAGAIPLMLLSPVGFEGLDLYGTTHIFVLDPHFNPERTRQLVSRAIRAYSNVNEISIKHYVATSEKLKKGCVDEAIIKIAQRKKSLADMVERCLMSD